MSLAGELRRLAERLDTPESRTARKERIPLALYQFFERVKQLTPVGTILDVGANVGNFAEAVAKRFPKTPIHAFEPLPGCFARLKSVAEKHPVIQPHPFAIGSEAGETEFHENDSAASSSLLEMTDRHRELWPKTANDHLTRVQVKTLDGFAKETPIKGPVFVKVDVQGFEMHVFRGGTDVLRDVAVIMAEVLFEPLYENQTDFLELQNFLAEHGFRFLEFCEETRLQKEHRLVYANAVFVKKELRYP